MARVSRCAKPGKTPREERPVTGDPSDKGARGLLPRCSVCGKPATPAFRPFCSQRCADVDLNRWFTGANAIPVKLEDLDDDTSRPEGGASE